MTKADEIKHLEEIQGHILKLVNARDGYVKDHLKEMFDISTLKDDMAIMCNNIKHDFMPLIRTKLNKIIHLHRKRIAILHMVILRLNHRQESMQHIIDDQAKAIQSSNELIDGLTEIILDALYNCEYKDATLNSLENKLLEYSEIFIIEKKIDMGIQLLPIEKKFVKSLLDEKKS